MRRVEIVRWPDTSQRQAIVDFVERISQRHDRRPLSDHLWLDLITGEGHGMIPVTAWDGGEMIGYAQVSAANDGSTLEVVVDDNVADAGRISADLAETVVDAFARDGGGRLTWWVDGTGDAALADVLGLAAERTLYEMRRTLPHPDHASIETRAFDARDADAWLAVNNRAFASHAEQGGWTRATLAQRMAEDWFDPEGFRIHELDGEIAGFCWTKIHTETDPVVGEIYVIAVDPAFHGRGLGRQLTLAGLDSIASRGVAIANLYVDAGNAAAVRLYQQLGFVVHRARTAFGGIVGTLERRQSPTTTAPSSPASPREP